MKRGCESVMPIAGGHGGSLLLILVVMSHIVIARLTPLWEEGSNHFVPTVENVFVKKAVTTYDCVVCEFRKSVCYLRNETKGVQ